MKSSRTPTIVVISIKSTNLNSSIIEGRLVTLETCSQITLITSHSLAILIWIIIIINKINILGAGAKTYSCRQPTAILTKNPNLLKMICIGIWSRWWGSKSIKNLEARVSISRKWAGVPSEGLDCKRTLSLTLTNMLNPQMSKFQKDTSRTIFKIIQTTIYNTQDTKTKTIWEPISKIKIHLATVSTETRLHNPISIAKQTAIYIKINWVLITIMEIIIFWAEKNYKIKIQIKI